MLDWSTDKLNKGTRFSVVYGLCGITFLLIGFANLCLAFGAYNYTARAAGLLCSCCLQCVNFAAIITTACFRFDTMGKLAALSEAPSKFVDTTPNGLVVLSSDRTMGSDASLIVWLWVMQLLIFLVGCCSTSRFNKPPSREGLA